jgi:hypothetical protein
MVQDEVDAVGIVLVFRHVAIIPQNNRRAALPPRAKAQWLPRRELSVILGIAGLLHVLAKRLSGK